MGSKIIFTSNVDNEIDWEDEVQYFKECLDGVVQTYEKQYNTRVVHLALIGQVGRWNGNAFGGRFLERNDNPLEWMGSVDEVRAVIDKEAKTLTLEGVHHDGVHRMSIYLITESKLSKYAPHYQSTGEVTLSELERIHNNTKPISYSGVVKYMYR